MYLNEDSASYGSKPLRVQKLINHALVILDCFGIPMEGPGVTSRRLERMAIAFLAVADVKTIEELSHAKDQSHKDHHAPRSRDIVAYINANFHEKISSGSYDNIRRQDLQRLLLGNIVLRSNPNSATNDSRRGYVLNPFYAELLRAYDGSEGWKKMVAEKLSGTKSVREILAAVRDIEKIPVKISGNKTLELTPGDHNILQKAIVEEFLTRYGFGAEILYLGDTAKKLLHVDKEALERLNFFELSHDNLPDVIAYVPERNWLYLIEAFHVTGHITQAKYELFQKLTSACSAEIIYVTAFLTREKFKSKAGEIAWETEVWIAENPDHLIHFNGDKFLGPYSNT